MAFTKGEGGGLGLMTPPYTHINNPPPLLSLLPPPIGRYYSIYDSSDRQGLLDAYHDGACCSLSIPFGPQNPPRYHPQIPLPTMCTPPPQTCAPLQVCPLPSPQALLLNPPICDHPSCTPPIYVPKPPLSCPPTYAPATCPQLPPSVCPKRPLRAPKCIPSMCAPPHKM